MKKFKSLIVFVFSVSILVGCTFSSDIKADVFSADDSFDDGASVIDVRTPEEFATGCIPKAKNVDVRSPDFLDKISELDKNGSYLVYCRSGARSSQAMEQMKNAGFKNIIELQGGITNWEQSGNELSTECEG